MTKIVLKAPLNSNQRTTKNLSVHSGGFEQFRQAYPRLCRAHDDEDLCAAPCLEVSRLSLSSDDHDTQQPTVEKPSLRELIVSSPPTLVAPFLYIGNAQNALDIDCLRTNGIRYIVNVTNSVPNRSVTRLTIRLHSRIHGRKSQGDGRRVPSIWNGDADAKCPPCFVMCQKFQVPDFLHYNALKCTA